MFNRKAKPTPTSEAPKPRTSQEIGQEFNNLAFKAGHVEFQIRTQKKELEALLSTLDVLEVEFKQAQNKEASDTAAQAAKEAKDRANAPA